MTKPTIWYQHEPYRSHNRTGRLYQQLLTPEYTLAPSAKEAGIVILHTQPWDYGTLYHRLPWLKNKYVISYCTWEANPLPLRYQMSLKLVQEVWTCSEYCASIFRPFHPRVAVIPHVVERDLVMDSLDELLVKRMIAWDPALTYFLAIVDEMQSRKNALGLAACFAALSSRVPNARLILKTSAAAPHVALADPSIIQLPVDLTDAQINALYRLSDFYVSPHRSEGWGLTLSDAMLFGLPVIATRYSGNLEYMNEANSYLIAAHECPVSAPDCYHLFTPGMVWSQPDMSELADTMLALGDGARTSQAQEKAANAQQDVARFNRATAQEAMFARLSAA